MEVVKEATEGEEKLAALQARRESTVGDKIAATGSRGQLRRSEYTL